MKHIHQLGPLGWNRKGVILDKPEKRSLPLSSERVETWKRIW